MPEPFLTQLVHKPLKPGHGIKLGIFAGIHGDEEAGTLATQELIRWAEQRPEELHSDDTSEGCYGFVSGDLLSEHLLEPALQAASAFLPRNEAPVIDGFNARHGIIKEGYLGILSAPPEQRPHALEIVFETPTLAPMEAQVKATVAAVKRILAEYRELQAYAANL